MSKWIPNVPLSLTLRIILLAMRSLFMLYVLFAQYSAIIAPNSTNQLNFVVGIECVFCEVCTHILLNVM